MKAIPATRFEEDSPVLDLRFPPLPGTVADVANLLSETREVPDTPKLVEIVNHDPVMAATILRRINSVYYGMRRNVSDLRKAVFLLGFLEVSNIVLTSAILKLREVLASSEQEHIFERIMSISILAAYYSQEIATYASLPQKACAFTNGLMHSMGRLVLLYNKPQDYEALWCTSERGTAPSPYEERTIFGTDHTELNARAAAFWNLPEEISEVIGSYRTPDAIGNADSRIQGRVLKLAVAAAERTCADPAKAISDDLSNEIIPLAAALKIDPSEIRSLLESISTHTPKLLENLLRD